GGATQDIYCVVPDPDAHFARAKAAGAEILHEPQDEPYGGRDYGTLDLEGHYWSFGSYQPGS
ncbi:MAG: VOC family protein, partial [Hyphomicrobiales bacterium]